MPIEENKALSRYWRDELDKGNWSVLDDYLTPNFTLHMPGSSVPIDREGMKQVLRSFYSAFPDLHHTFEDQIAEGDKVALRMTFRGTHRGEFQGIPPTGREITVTAIVIDRIENGKLAEHWSQFDALSLMQQLGVIPAPGQGGA